ncbi:MAG: DUF1223 domain-containing protein [Sedimenticolaceae bacterium]
MSTAVMRSGLARVSAAWLLCAAACLAEAGASSEQRFASGSQQTTLVELFTSQGCSSCPPAERWLGDLKDDPRLWREIIPVAFHVDYWDYIGWQDTFADPKFSARQRRYHSEDAIDTVYTPGFVVNGREWRGWFQRRALPVAKTQPGNLQLSLTGRQLKASYTPSLPAGATLNLQVALLGTGLEVDVARGENSGRRLAQDFTVLQLITLSSTDGNWSVTLPEIAMPDGGRPAIAAWVSDTATQRPLQAVGGWIVTGG